MKNLKDITFIHYGTGEYKRNLFADLENSTSLSMKNKPIGGFWACELIENSFCKSAWEEYVHDCEWDISVLGESFKFKIKEDSKIYIVDNKEDLKYLEDKYPIENSPLEKICGHKLIDYVEMSKDYDGLLLTDDGLYENYDKLESWCIESICIFNPDIILNEK